MEYDELFSKLWGSSESPTTSTTKNRRDVVDYSDVYSDNDEFGASGGGGRLYDRGNHVENKEDEENKEQDEEEYEHNTLENNTSNEEGKEKEEESKEKEEESKEKEEESKDKEEESKDKEEESKDKDNQEYELDSITGLYFHKEMDMYFDPQNQIHYDHKTGGCYWWNPDTNLWEDLTYLYTNLYTNLFHNARSFNSDDPPEEPLQVTPSTMELVMLEAETGLELDPPRTYYIGRDAQSDGTSKKKTKLGEKENILRITTSIGRSRKNNIQLRDPEVSSIHCEIIWESLHFQNFFSVRDLGSVNGTWVNDQRLSQMRETSRVPVLLGNGDQIWIGKTFRFHVRFPLEEDPFGLKQLQNKKIDYWNNMDTVNPLKANRQLYKDLLYSNNNSEENWKNKDQYRDRAKERRIDQNTGESKELDEEPQEIFSRPLGGPPPHPMTIHTPLPETNIGHQMLKKMGWKADQGIGKLNQGITNPIPILPTHSKLGLGLR